MVTVLQSPSDKKSYRHFQLPNGLTVLLIHDPTVAAGLQGGTQVRPLPLPPLAAAAITAARTQHVLQAPQHYCSTQQACACK